MNYIEIAAYLGAAAWLPPAFQLFRNITTKPHVLLFPETIAYAGIGYTTYGPIVNLNLSLLSKHKDCLIRNIKLILRHQSGTLNELDWRGGITETAFHTTNLRGLKENTFEKEYKPIAHYLEKNKLLERAIRFRDKGFEQRKRGLTATAKKALQTKISQFIDSESGLSDTQINELVKLEQVQELIEFYKNYSFWQEGAYMLSFTIESEESTNFQKESFDFTVDSSSIKLLNNNKPHCETDVINEIRYATQKEPDCTNPSWNWCDLRLTTSNQSSQDS